MLYQAYTFDPTYFHSVLQERIVREGQIRRELLLALAQTVVENATDNTRQALQYMRFDPEWMVESADSNHSSEWYMIILAEYLLPALSLADESSDTLSLNSYLSGLNWTTEEIRKLLHGNPLHTLVESSQSTLIIDEFRLGVDQFGGWLSQDDASVLLSRLQSVGQQLSQLEPKDLPSHEERIGTYRYFSPELRLRWLVGGYALATRMLQIAIARKSALYIIVD